MKKFIALAMALVMCLALFAGCGQESNTEPSTPAESGTPESGTPAEGASFKFGVVGPLTGENAIYGNAVANGVQIAVEEINAAGGINGYQVEVSPQDDVSDGETSVNAYNNLMDWGMQVLIGPVTTGPAISVSTEVYNDRIFALTPSASSPDVVAGKDNMFQMCFSDPNQGSGAATYMGANMPDAKIAVIYRNDDAYSQGIRDTFVAEAENQNLEIVYEGTFTADTQADFSVQLTAAQAAGADVVFLPIYYQPASVILSQANGMGYEPTFFGVDGMDGILTMPNFDLSLAEGVMVLTPFSADATDEKTVNFVTEYNERFGETPNQFAADGYDCVYALKQAIEAAGCTPDMSYEDICTAMIEQFTSMTFDGLTGTGMTWSTAGEVSKLPLAVVIQDGVYVSAENAK
ncbi:MAG TPA: ABC transporter substrate-binding protein [Candidatus Scatomorpha merdigallinarum]|nr:ABC transporter substrate-binding protein [Candidatus Scatomorpha merdigallinarum]